MDSHEVHDELVKLGIKPYEFPEDAAELSIERFAGLIRLMVGHLKYLRAEGHIKFTPQTINSELDPSEDDTFEAWMEESAEEFLVG